MNKGAES